jgi:hypothetical protein
MSFGPRIGERSTHQVKCVVCEQTYGNAASHDCPFKGLGLRRKLEAIEERLARLEGRSSQATGKDPDT